jgi:glycosyltransferase involved in cell wall biosynthesis
MSDSAQALSPEEDIELTILMPCLNEAETLGMCIGKALRFLARTEIAGEVLVADNGSTDGSIEIANELKSRVVNIPVRGYGAALQGGIRAARGRYVIMGDADDSYDFENLDLFVNALRAGNDLVIGNRFLGGIEPGAMPLLHRYLGNPVLSFIGRLFFRVSLQDFHCGLRGFARAAIRKLELRTTGMEYASEMVVRSALAHLKIAEVPTKLAKDGRSRPPHLRTWRDGWRHLQFLLLFSPRWLFLYPGLVMTLLGATMTGLLLFGPVHFGGLGFDIRTMLVACTSCIVGVQSVCFATIARNYALSKRLVPYTDNYRVLLDQFTLDRLVAAGAVFLIAGLLGLIAAVISWGEVSFGNVEYTNLLRLVTLSVTGIGIGVQLILSGFLTGLLAIELSRD